MLFPNVALCCNGPLMIADIVVLLSVREVKLLKAPLVQVYTASYTVTVHRMMYAIPSNSLTWKLTESLDGSNTLKSSAVPFEYNVNPTSLTYTAITANIGFAPPGYCAG